LWRTLERIKVASRVVPIGHLRSRSSPPLF
jgi:hypothetical protein